MPENYDDEFGPSAFDDLDAGGYINNGGGNHGEPVLAGPPPAKAGFDISSFLTGIGGAYTTGRGIYDRFTGVTQNTIPTTNANASRPASGSLFGGLNPTMIAIIIGAALFFLWRRR